LRESLPQARLDHVAADFADPSTPSLVVQTAQERFGRVDILVANHARSASQSLGTLTAEELDRCFAVNVRATLLLIQAFAARHDGAPGGRVIYFTSGQHLHPMPDELPYIASKGTLQQLTTSLAAALTPGGITVNCINPGATDTGYASAEEVAAVAARHPQGRWSTPEDAARLIAWLCSDEGAWITGQVLVSDGGLYLGLGGLGAPSPNEQA
jgi:3-oxoacyl-[acyl-carrier protein] reductase